MLKEEISPAQWKKQKLVFLPKLGDLALCPPIFLLDTVGKIMEIDSYSPSKTAMVCRSAVVRLVKDAANYDVCCVVVPLYVKNAFNFVNWGRIESLLADLGLDIWRV